MNIVYIERKMFGFDGELDCLLGFWQIINNIANNEAEQNYTHKQVRAYARCLLVLVNSLQVDHYQKAQITVLLAGISARGLPHYDRSFLAEQLQRILDKAIEKATARQDRCDNSNF